MPHGFLRHFNLPDALSSRLMEEDFLALASEMIASAKSDCRIKPQVHISVVRQKERTTYVPYTFKKRSSLSSGYDRVEISISCPQKDYIAVCSVSCTAEDSWFRLEAPFLSHPAAEQRFQDVLRFLHSICPSETNADCKEQPNEGDCDQAEVEHPQRFYKSPTFWTAVESITAVGTLIFAVIQFCFHCF
jgi:hypothetical protein